MMVLLPLPTLTKMTYSRDFNDIFLLTLGLFINYIFTLTSKGRGGLAKYSKLVNESGWGRVKNLQNHTNVPGAWR